MNYEACKNCPSLQKCTKSSHRIISEFANENTLKLKQYMDTKEAQNEYKKRGSTVEAPFGILKILLQLQQPKNTWNTTNRKHNELMCTITQHKKIIQHKTQHTQRNNRNRQLPRKTINIIRNRTHSYNKIKKVLTNHKKIYLCQVLIV